MAAAQSKQAYANRARQNLWAQMAQLAAYNQAAALKSTGNYPVPRTHRGGGGAILDHAKLQAIKEQQILDEQALANARYDGFAPNLQAPSFDVPGGFSDAGNMFPVSVLNAGVKGGFDHTQDFPTSDTVSGGGPVVEYDETITQDTSIQAKTLQKSISRLSITFQVVGTGSGSFDEDDTLTHGTLEVKVGAEIAHDIRLFKLKASLQNDRLGYAVNIMNVPGAYDNIEFRLRTRFTPSGVAAEDYVVTPSLGLEYA